MFRPRTFIPKNAGGGKTNNAKIKKCMQKGKNDTLAPGNIQMCDPHEIADNTGPYVLVLLRGKSWCSLAQCGQYNSKNKDKQQAIIKHAINTMLKPKMRPVSLPPKTFFCRELTKSANEENALKKIYAAPGGGNINK